MRIGRGRRDMKINALTIRNFKSIRELHIDDIDSALIVVGKNSTGKTAILDAVLAVAGLYTVSSEDFNLQESNIEVEVLLEITESDLAMLNRQGMISKYKRYDIWFSDFCEKLPSYQDGVLSFTFVANKDGKVRYWDAKTINTSRWCCRKSISSITAGTFRRYRMISFWQEAGNPSLRSGRTAACLTRQSAARTAFSASA